MVVIALYAVAVVGLDTLRPFQSTPGTVWPLSWYPIATLGFDADNDGKVIAVDPDGPAWRAGLRVGQHIDLPSVAPDRRAIDNFVYVAHGSTYTLRVGDTPNDMRDIRIHAVDAKLEGLDAATLLVAQASALFFIALCCYLVWRRATWSTWGFFIYGMWFNAGQYFVWYANLSTVGLAGFDALQALIEPAALTGFVAFALFFPEDRPPPMRRPVAWKLLLAVVFVMLVVTGSARFLNYLLAWRTEAVYDAYNACAFVGFLIAASLLVKNYRRLPEQRPRMRWIVAAALIGLPCFLLADAYEATSLFNDLPFGIEDWIRAHDWILNLLYSMSALLPAAVTYTAFSQEVMSVRFGLTRAVVLSGVFVVMVSLLHLAASSPVESFIEHRGALKPLAVPVSLVIAMGLSLIHNPLHGLVERLCAPKWHRAKVELKAIAQRLLDDDSLTATDVDGLLVHGVAQALWLERAALFAREQGDRFVLRATFNWPAEASQELRADHPWARCEGYEPVRLVDPDQALDSPELVVPIRHAQRQPASHLVLYGHHVTAERIDPDEMSLIRNVARAAAFAYMRLALDAQVESAPGDASQRLPPAA